MKPNKVILVLTILHLISYPLKSQVAAVKVGNRIDISIGDNLFTRYVCDENEKYPFFFPVNGPSGASVTSMRNNPYPHHTSLFIACDRVNGGNYWQEGLDRGQILSLRNEIKESGGDRVVIENENIWWRPGAESPVRDVRVITITAPSKTCTRWILISGWICSPM